VLSLHSGVDLPKKDDFLTQRIEIEQICFEGIIEVGGVVSDFVDPVDELGFQGRTEVEEILLELRKIRGAIVPRMLDNSFAHLKGKVQARKSKVAVFKLFDDSQGVKIVIKTAAMSAHQLVEFAFSPVPERRMTDIVD
jgi:hypothetical protein